MRREPDPVPGAVDEAVAVAGLGDDGTRRSVDLLARHAGADGLESGLLRVPDELVDGALLVGRLAHVDCPRRVGAVPVLQPAEVEHDHVALLDHARAGLVMRVRAVRPRRDDGEVDAGMAVPQQELREVGGDVGLLPTREPELEEVGEGGVHGCSGCGHARQFLVVLDRAEQRQGLGHRHVARSGEALLQAEHVHRPRCVGDGVARVRVQERRRRLVWVAPVAPVVERERRGARRALGVGALERGDDQRRVTCGRHDQHRQALGDRHRDVAAEVGQVRPGRDEDAREPGFLGRPGGAFHPGGEVLGGERSHGEADGTSGAPAPTVPTCDVRHVLKMLTTVCGVESAFGVRERRRMREGTCRQHRRGRSARS